MVRSVINSQGECAVVCVQVLGQVWGRRQPCLTWRDLYRSRGFATEAFARYPFRPSLKAASQAHSDSHLLPPTFQAPSASAALLLALKLPLPSQSVPSELPVMLKLVSEAPACTGVHSVSYNQGYL